MNSSVLKLFAGLVITSVAVLLPVHAQAKDKFSVCWSIYVGWMPWDFGSQQGIVKKWADKYDIEIDVVQINDYVESINQYSAGAYDGCTMTNMDALTIPAAGGIDSTALIVGDFSNGNDGVVLKDKSALKDIKGQTVNLVELSVSHYLLARGLGYRKYKYPFPLRKAFSKFTPRRRLGAYRPSKSSHRSKNRPSCYRI